MNADRGSKERIAQLFAVAGQTRTPVTEMVAGDIGATVKLKDVRRGNTLNGKGCDYRFDFCQISDPKYRAYQAGEWRLDAREDDGNLDTYA